MADLSFEVISDKQGAEAKQDAFDQAIVLGTQRLVEDILGADKAASQWPNLKTKLLKNSTRFVLFVKGGPPQEQVQPGGAIASHINVQLKMSPDVIESLLREAGALSSGGVRILPLIEVVDAQGRRSTWWTDGGEKTESSTAEEILTRFFVPLANKSRNKGLFVLDATSSALRMGVPAAYRTPHLRREDQMLFAQYLKADIVVSGRLEVLRTAGDATPLKLSYALQVWQAKSGREIHEVQRLEGINSDATKVILAAEDSANVKVIGEITSHVAEVVTAGNLNLNSVKVAITGALNYHQQMDLRRALSQIRTVRAVKERYLTADETVYEVETQATGTDLKGEIEKLRVPQMRIAVQSALDDRLALQVTATASSSAQ